MHAFPGAIVTPRAEVAPHRRPGRILMRQGTPLTAGAVYVQDGVEHFAHISGAGSPSWLGGRNERFEYGPFLLGQIAGVTESFHFSTSSIFPFFFSYIIPLYTQPLNSY